MFWEDQGSVPFSHINLATVSKIVKITSSKKCLYILIEKYRLTQKANKPCEHNQTTSLWYKTQDFDVRLRRGSGKRGKGGSVWFELWSGGAGKYWRAFILSCVWGDSKYIPLRQKLMWGVYGGKEAAYRIDPENEFSAKISSSKVLLWSLWKKFETNYCSLGRVCCTRIDERGRGGSCMWWAGGGSGVMVRTLPIPPTCPSPASSTHHTLNIWTPSSQIQIKYKCK